MTSYRADMLGNEIVCFFSFRSEFSNFYPCTIKDEDGIIYTSSEQLYMRQKALFFGDLVSAAQIMRTQKPREAKQIGKTVKGFNQRRWDGISRRVMHKALMLKFSQNESLKRSLIDTGDRTLIECSPYDSRWGIGLDADDPRVLDPSLWRGQNWLGMVLMASLSSLSSSISSPSSSLPSLPSLSSSPLLIEPSISAPSSVPSSPPEEKIYLPALNGANPSLSPSQSMPSSLSPVLSANLWNSANSPRKKKDSPSPQLSPLTTVRSPNRGKKKNQEMILKAFPLFPRSTENSLSLPSSPNLTKEVSSHTCPITSSPPSSSLLNEKNKKVPKKTAATVSREERKGRISISPIMTIGWYLHLQSVAKLNNKSLTHILKEEFPNATIDRRKVSDKLKKLLESERIVIKNGGDYSSFCNTPISLPELCSPTIDRIESIELSTTPTFPIDPPSSPSLSIPIPIKSHIVHKHSNCNSPCLSNFSSHSSSLSTLPSSPNPPLHPILISSHYLHASQNQLSASSNSQPPPSPTHTRSFSINSITTPKSRPTSSAVLRSRLNQRLKRLEISRDNHKKIASVRLQEKKSVEKELRKMSSKFASQDVKLNNAVNELVSVKSELSNKKKELRSSSKRLCIREEETAVLKPIPNGLTGSLITMEEGQYTASCVKTILELKTCGVSDRNVGPVMDKVYKSAGIIMSHIPSKSTVGRTSFVAKALTNKQTHSVLSDQINRQANQLSGMCLLSDETTKWKHKMQGYSATMINENGEKINHVIGMRAVASKDAETSLDTVMEMLDEIDKSSTATPAHAHVAGQFRDLVMTYMNSVMGDRASTQVKFGNILQEYRKKILPKIRGWDTMSAKEKYLHGLFINVPCFVHCLASLTEPVIEALAQQQIKTTGCKDLPLNNPSVLVLLKQLTKHFGPRSSAKYATYKNYIAWCTSSKQPPVRLPSLKGNRFNVVPAAAARIFAYRDHFLAFTHVFPTDDLKLMRRGLSDPLIIAQLLVLALVDVYVTGPLWRLSKGDISVTETPKFISELLEWVESREDNPNLLFQGGIPQFSVPTDVHAFKLDDTMVKILVAANPTQLALDAAKLSMNAISGFFRRVFAPFLPGGQYYKLLTAKGPLAERAHAALAATAANNVPSESIFGLADWLLNRAPRSRISRIATGVLMRKNKTISWLESFSAGAQDKIIKECIKMGPTLEKQDQADIQKVTEKVCSKMQEIAANEKVTREREQKESDKLTIQLLEYGFFHTEDDLDKFIARDLGYAVTRNFLSLQLKFRKKVMRQPTFEANCFTINPRFKQFSMAILVDKVRTAIKKDKKIPVKIFCGLDVSTSITGKYMHIEDYGSYPCEVIACMKASQGGPSYALIKYLCGSGKHFVVEEDFFSYYIQSGMFKKVNAGE